MKQLAVGLSFLCFYFLLPTGAQSQSFMTSHDRVAGVLSKPASCMVIRSAECSKRIMIGSGLGGAASLPFVKPQDLKFETMPASASRFILKTVAFADRKHVLRTGLSPPLFS